MNGFFTAEILKSLAKLGTFHQLML